MVRFIFFILFLFPSLLLADTYPAQYIYYNANGAKYSSLQAACSSYPPNGYTIVASKDCNVASGSSCYAFCDAVSSSTTYKNYYSVLKYYSYYCPYGGTLSGSSCINAPACASGSTRQPDGSCLANQCPPVGTPKEIAIPQGSLNNSDGTIDISIGSTSPYTAYSDGVEYGFGDQDYSGSCFADSNSKIQCNYNARSTGNCDSTKPNNSNPKQTSGSQVPTNQDGTCKTDSHSNTVCSSSPAGNQKCGEVNGARVCFDQTPGTGTINNQPYQNAGNDNDKNCGMLNGEAVCVSNDSNSPTNKGCLVNGSVKQCVNSDVKISSSVTQTKNPDGSVTTTRQETDNIIGHQPNLVTTTQNPDGSVTIHKSPGQVGTGVSTDSTGTCVGCATEDTLKAVKGSVDGLGGKIDALTHGSGKSKGAPGNGFFDNSIPEAAAAQAKADFQAAFLQVKSGLATSFNFAPSTGVGSLPVIDMGTIKGSAVVVDLNRYADELSMIGTVIVFAALILAAIMLFG